MLKSYVATAVRQLLTQKLYAAINIAGLAIGLASCLLISLYVRHETSFENAFPKADRIYRISRDYYARGGARARVPASNNAPVAPALLEDFPEIEQAARVFGGRMLVTRGEAAFYEDRFRWADNAVFRIFDFDWIAGDPKTALVEPSTVVVTESTARKYFGSENAVGRTLTIDLGGTETPLRVTGVIRDLPDNTHLSLDAAASIATLPHKMLEQWNSNTDYHTYILLRPGASIASVRRRIPAFMNRHIAADASTWSGMTITNVRDIHLHSTRDEEWKPVGRASTVYGFAAVAVLILLIACINFTNLSTARAAKRAREVGVRRALGATRGQLVLQFLGETLVTVALALVLAAALVELLSPALGAFLGTRLGLDDLGPAGAAAVAVGLVLVVGLAAGAYPAFYLSAFEPAKVVKGDVTGGAGGAAFRNALVVAQFAASIALLVATAIVYEQTSFARNLDLGFDKDRVVVVTGGIGDRWQALKERLLRLPGVVAVTASHYTPFSFNDNRFVVRSDGGSSASRIQFMAVDYDFFRTYRIDVLAGRAFSADFPGDALTAATREKPGGGAFVLNASAARLLGWSPDEAAGQYVELGSDERFTGDFLRVRVAGVVADTYFESVHERVRPMIYVLYGGVWPARAMTASIRVSGRNVPATLDAIDAAWRGFVPDRPVARHFLDTDFEALYRSDERKGALFASFAGLAVLIACLGLFGLVSFATERRTKEIGVRKVLGGTAWDIVMLFAGQLGKLVLLANAIAWPVVYLVMRRWLEGFAYRIDMSPWVYLGCGIAVLVLALSTVGAVALRAAGAKPSRSLRYE